METRFEPLYTRDSYGPFPPINYGGGKPTWKSAAACGQTSLTRTRNPV